MGRPKRLYPLGKYRLRQCRNKKDSFFRDTITPLITEDTQVYRELESEIFI